MSAGVGSAGRRRNKGHDGVTPGPSGPTCRDAVPSLAPQEVCTGQPGTQKKPCHLLQEQLKAGPAPLSLKKGDATGWALP